jgi:ParB-like chromosome segregation protein Spo0J
MNHKVDPSLTELLVEIDTLIPLENNPRRGNVDAIASSYESFGQLKPVVVRPNEDGTSTVLAGNHQVEAARRLGWTHIAAVKFGADDKHAIAFALADNRTNELGYTDPSDLHEMIGEIGDEYQSLLDDLGWDMFEMASLSEQAYASNQTSEDFGYVPPVLISGPDAQAVASVEETEDGARLVPAVEADNRQLAATGSTLIGATSGKKNAIVQYSLVFDSVEQQSKWYGFIRWLRDDPSIDGETTAERLLNFIDAHADF